MSAGQQSNESRFVPKCLSNFEVDTSRVKEGEGAPVERFARDDRDIVENADAIE